MSFEMMRSIDNDEWKRGFINRDASLAWTSQLPVPPDDTVQRAFTGKANAAAFEQAFAAVEQFVASAAALGAKITPTSRLLDFGCGWGRITQAAYRYVDPAYIIAADVQHNILDVCARTGVKARFLPVVGKRLDLEDSSIDFVISYSVFSHLNEKAHLGWLRELHRVLAPGGCIAVTTRAENMIRHVKALAQADEITVPQTRLVEAFGDPEQMLAELEQGRFVFRAYPSPAQNLDEDYGEAFIPESYVHERWSELFPSFRFVAPNRGVDQKMIVARKPA